MEKFNFEKLTGNDSYRSAPFWAWNGKLDPEEIRRQVRVMHDMHMGGFFMHSRAGLSTEYLGKEWFDCINAAIDEAEKLNMHADLYDEDRWPSGAAGGIVTKDKRYRMRYLEEYDIDSEVPGEAEDFQILNIFAVEHDAQGEVINYRKAIADEILPENWSLKKYAARIAHSQPGYNDAAYLDTTSAEAVQAFIDSTYEKYYQECGSKFGKTVKYFFTDEPNYLDAASPERRPWNDKLAQLFSDATSRDLLDYLPELFHNCSSKFSSVRYNYYRIMTGLFTDTFMKMIGEWCSKHNIMFTGHVLREDTLSSQVLSIGSAMPCYEYMQAPGIDVLTAKWVVLNTAKQISSVAHQLDKKLVLSELYGCTGWDFPLYGQKSWAEWQYVMGINFRCQHLAWYTMQGEAKRDYPASINCQSPWQSVYAPLEDYFVRLGSLLAEAEKSVPLLVLHPIETMWGYAGSWGKGQNFAPEYDKKFSDTASSLLASQLAFDYGDESLMEKYASAAGNTFQIGKANYKAVLLPEVETLRESTVNLLEKFVSNNGQVYYLGEIPSFIDGNPDLNGRLTELYSSFKALGSDFAEVLLERLGEFSVRNSDQTLPANLLTTAGKLNGQADLLYAVNIGCELATSLDAPWLDDRQMPGKDLKMKYNAPAGREVFKIDLFSGKIGKIAFEYQNNLYCWSDDVDAQTSNVYLIAEKAFMPEIPETAPIKFNNECTLSELPATLSEDNILVLDHADAYDNGVKIAENCYILNIDKQLRQNHSWLLRGSSQPQPWYRQKTGRSFPAALEFEFFCEKDFSSDVELIIESPEIFTITLNNTAVSNQSTGFWCDVALKKVALPRQALAVGKNVLRLEFDYSEDFAGLESLLLMGSFGVKNQNTLTAPQKIAAGKSLTEQAMPFYSGNTTYKFEFVLDKAATCQLQLGQWAGSAVSIRWDDDREECFYTLPGTQKSSKALAAGKHIASVTVYGHRRNTFGPFYCTKRSCWIGPYEFTVTDRDSKEVVPLGLLSTPELYTV